MKNNKTVFRAMAIVVVLLIVLPLVIMLSGCNQQIIDVTFSFDRAIISLPNGEVIEGEVQSWKDYEDGDQIQVKIGDVTYLAHSEDVVLIAE